MNPSGKFHTKDDRISELENKLSRTERELADLKRLECPWPESVWTMTEDQYVKAVPDEETRTAISGFLMRLGWTEAMLQINKED